MFLLVWLIIQFLVFLACSDLIQASYFLDDSNTTIHYDGSSWTATDSSEPQYSWVDDPRVFKGTLTHSNCTTVNNCHVRVTFTGVGITVYNVIRSSINLSISLDQGPPTSFEFVDDLQCLNTNTNTQACYNQTTYDNQALSYGSHMLDITLLSPSDPTHPSSDFYLDYMVINDTNPNSNATSTATNPNPSPVSSHQFRNIVGGAIGGVIGGIVLAAVLFLVLRRKRRRVARSQIISDSQGANNPNMRASSAFRIDSRSNQANLVIPSPFLSQFPPPVPMKSKSQAFTASSTSTQSPATSNGSEPTIPRGPITKLSLVTLPAASEPIQSLAGSSQALSSVSDPTVLETSHLSNEQVEFVHDLYRMNVPAPAIAGVMGRMLREGGQASDYSESPPGYYEAK